MVVVHLLNFSCVLLLRRSLLLVHSGQGRELPLGEGVVGIDSEEPGRKPLRYPVYGGCVRVVSHLFVEVAQSLLVKRLLEHVRDGVAEGLLPSANSSPFGEEHSLAAEA